MMLKDNLKSILSRGQSVWYDNVSRELISNGDLAGYIDQGVRGLTSNPSIFEKAISTSRAYDNDLKQLVAAESDIAAAEVIDRLMVMDIQRVCDLLLPIYEQSDAADGYASIEVSPLLANDTKGTIEAAKNLHALVSRPNVMIKIPATEACYAAIEEVLYAGISVNVTLIFSEQQYRSVVTSHQNAIQRRLQDGLSCERIASVASFFVSRVDSACDSEIKKTPKSSHLLGTMALANCRTAYSAFEELYGEGSEFAAHQGKAQVQRPLWASTSVKNPDYPALKYVTPLVLAHTVNTLPHVSVQALEQEPVDYNHEQLVSEQVARKLIDEFDKIVPFDKILTNLLEDGLVAFADAYNRLLGVIEKRLGDL